MKPIYVIQNDNCGIIGVFGNMKSAYKFASKRQQEIADANGWSNADQSRDLEISYSKMTSELRDTVNYSVYLDFEAETYITCFELNRADYK